MFFQFALWMIRVDGRDESDSALLEFVDDPANRVRILLDEYGDFFRELPASVKPRNLKQQFFDLGSRVWEVYCIGGKK